MSRYTQGNRQRREGGFGGGTGHSQDDRGSQHWRQFSDDDRQRGGQGYRGERGWPDRDQQDNTEWQSQGQESGGSWYGDDEHGSGGNSGWSGNQDSWQGQGYGYGGQQSGYPGQGYSRGNSGRQSMGRGDDAYGGFGSWQGMSHGGSHHGQGGFGGRSQNYAGQGYGGGAQNYGGQGYGGGSQNYGGQGYGGGSQGYGGQSYGSSQNYGGSSGTKNRGPKGYQRSDERLKEDVCERLSRTSHIDASEVSVEVQNGKVTLTGTVPQRGMKHSIEDLVDQCMGVKDIENRVQVSRESNTNDTQSGKRSGSQSGSGSSQSSTSSATGSSASSRKDH